jgi:predicted Zn-dependent protease with MMP-like domain
MTKRASVEKDRERFDRLLEEVLDALPEELAELLEEVPLIVDDLPDAATRKRLGARGPLGLCGLYTGIPLTRRSVEHSGTLPDAVTIFRRGIIESARGRDGKVRDAALRRQIRITVLHEIGHHFGFTEAQLRKHGYA